MFFIVILRVYIYIYSCIYVYYMNDPTYTRQGYFGIQILSMFSLPAKILIGLALDKIGHNLRYRLYFTISCVKICSSASHLAFRR